MIPVSVQRRMPYNPYTRNIVLTVFEHCLHGATRVVGEVWRFTDGSWLPYVRGRGIHIGATYASVSAACLSQGWSLLIPVSAPCGRCEAYAHA